MAAQVIIPKAFLFFLVIAAFAVVSGQDSESMTPAAPAPATGMEAGAGFSLPVCGAIVGFSLVMKKWSVVSWNIMISCLAQSLRDSEALGLFHDMLDWGFKPDEATVVTVLPICARSGSVDVGKWIHSYEDNVF
ncbi:hypothetical protein D5086_012243 [Populus alba]|uniref:Uncharacterized protein n=1 Tax=Populus alba TaxID=43335 RepID=A0ACC4C1X6_POPAL